MNGKDYLYIIAPNRTSIDVFSLRAYGLAQKIQSFDFTQSFSDDADLGMFPAASSEKSPHQTRRSAYSHRGHDSCLGLRRLTRRRVLGLSLVSGHCYARSYPCHSVCWHDALLVINMIDGQEITLELHYSRTQQQTNTTYRSWGTKRHATNLHSLRKTQSSAYCILKYLCSAAFLIVQVAEGEFA